MRRSQEALRYRAVDGRSIAGSLTFSVKTPPGGRSVVGQEVGYLRSQPRTSPAGFLQVGTMIWATRHYSRSYRRRRMSLSISEVLRKRTQHLAESHCWCWSVKPARRLTPSSRHPAFGEDPHSVNERGRITKDAESSAVTWPVSIDESVRRVPDVANPACKS